MNFQNLYNLKRKEFEEHGLFVIIKGKQNPIDWPNSSGVYAIWKNNQKDNELIYIGMTGKFFKNNNGIVCFNNASFRKRAIRWTPYRFCEDKIRDQDMLYHFRYGPYEKNTNEQGKIRFNENAYSSSIPYENMEIHCFCINSNHIIYSPLLLESELLTKYLKTYGSLPPANNSL